MNGHAFVELGPDDVVTIEMQHLYGPVVPGAELVVRCGRSTPIRIHLDNLAQLTDLGERIAEVADLAEASSGHASSDGSV